MNQKTKLIWLEVGLAIALIISLSLLGAKLGAENQKKEKKIEQAEAENQMAAEKSESKSGEGKTDDRNKGGSEAAGQMEASVTETEEVIADGQYPIMGKSSVTVEQMASYFQTGGEGAPYPAEQLSKGGADSIETFCQIYYEECIAEGVRPEVAFVQTMKETGWLQFGGDTSVEQFNFARLGTTGGGVREIRTGCPYRNQGTDSASEGLRHGGCIGTGMCG